MNFSRELLGRKYQDLFYILVLIISGRITTSKKPMLKTSNTIKSYDVWKILTLIWLVVGLFLTPLPVGFPLITQKW